MNTKKNKHFLKPTRWLLVLICQVILCLTACSQPKTDPITAIDDEMLDVVGLKLSGPGSVFMLDILTKLKQEETVDINARDTDYDDHTPLHYAVITNHTKLIQAILDRNPDLNARTKAFQKTPLMVAAQYSSASAVAMLVETPGVDLNAQDKEGCTALHDAVNYENSEIANLLVHAKGIDINIKNADADTPLKRAYDLQDDYKLPVATWNVDKQSRILSVTLVLQLAGATF